MFCHIILTFSIFENFLYRSADNEFRHHRFLKIGKEYKFDIYTQEAHRCQDLKNAKKKFQAFGVNGFYQMTVVLSVEYFVFNNLPQLNMRSKS